MSSSSVLWLPWSVDAFARARAERKPVLLSISTVWSQGCRDMEQTCYSDSTIAGLIGERFIPVRVDADRRPDISERYTLGGWPTTAFLTANGDVVAGGTYVPADRMVDLLQRIADAFDTRSGEITRGAEAASAIAADASERRETEASLTTQAFESFDAEHGGFGSEPKAPLSAPIRLALDICRERPDDAVTPIVVTSLDAMGWRGLYDEVDGGFFRIASSRDWEDPHFEKLLDVQASLLPLYVDAARVLQIERYADRAADLLRYVQTWLADPVDGAWAASQSGGAAYFGARTSDERSTAPPPEVDATIYAGWNGAMVSAALHAAEAMGEGGLAEFAIKSLERVLMACYRPGAGVAHGIGEGSTVRGLLDDQVAVATACLDAHEATGNIVYEMMAEELMRYAIREMWDDEHGGFFDRAIAEPEESVGRMRSRLRPFVSNCQAGAILYRLGRTSGEPELHDRAETTLAAVESVAARSGTDAAYYVLARRASRVR